MWVCFVVDSNVLSRNHHNKDFIGVKHCLEKLFFFGEMKTYQVGGSVVVFVPLFQATTFWQSTVGYGWAGWVPPPLKARLKDGHFGKLKLNAVSKMVQIISNVPMDILKSVWELSPVFGLRRNEKQTYLIELVALQGKSESASADPVLGFYTAPQRLPCENPIWSILR